MPHRRIAFDPRTATVMTREEAINQGLVRYFTGQPCKRGHLTFRYVANGGCESCLRPPPNWHRRGDQGIQYNARLKIAMGPYLTMDWAAFNDAVQAFADRYCAERQLEPMVEQIEVWRRQLSWPQGDDDYVKEPHRTELVDQLARLELLHAQTLVATGYAEAVKAIPPPPRMPAVFKDGWEV